MSGLRGWRQGGRLKLAAQAELRAAMAPVEVT